MLPCGGGAARPGWQHGPSHPIPVARSLAGKASYWPPLPPEGRGGDTAGSRHLRGRLSEGQAELFPVWSVPDSALERSSSRIRAACRNLEEGLIEAQGSLIKGEKRQEAPAGPPFLSDTGYAVLWDGWAGLFWDALDKQMMFVGRTMKAGGALRSRSWATDKETFAREGAAGEGHSPKADPRALLSEGCATSSCDLATVGPEEAGVQGPVAGRVSIFGRQRAGGEGLQRGPSQTAVTSPHPGFLWWLSFPAFCVSDCLPEPFLRH